MIVLIISAVIGLSVAYKLAQDIDFGWVAGIVVGGVAFFVSFSALTLIIGNVLLPRTFVTANSDLVVLQDGASTSGVMFLGSGYVDGTLKYSYYKKSGDAKELVTSDSEGVKVFDNSSKAYVVEETNCKTVAEWLSSCFSMGGLKEIHIPAGSIKNGYVLDAKS